MKRIIAKINKNNAVVVWDADDNKIIGIIKNTSGEDEEVDITERLSRVVKEEFNAEEVTLVKNCEYAGYENNFFVSFDTVEEEESSNRLIQLTTETVY